MSTATVPQRYVYFFAEGHADGGREVQHLVGGKGASLADMTRAGLNVPPGFTISAECCDLFFRSGRCWPDGLEPEVRASLARLERVAGRSLGRGDNPLLVAVRSGAAQSMPGMMDTILNVGLNSECVRAITGRAAWEAYRHFLVQFGHVVAGIGEDVFAALIEQFLRDAGRRSEDELDAGQMEALCDRVRAVYGERAGRAFPVEPWEMLRQAIDAVFDSWNNERALAYRQHHRVEGMLGTAVTVQMMCPSEVSGILFTANPVNPALEQMLVESSFGLGEAIVLGKVTPDRFVIDKRSLCVLERAVGNKEHVTASLAHDARTRSRDAASLSDPQIEELARLGLRVEEYFQRPSDIEWGLSQGQFYLLQARAIKGLGAPLPSGERGWGEGGASARGPGPLTPGPSPPEYRGRGETSSPEERERVRREEIAALAARAEPSGTVWCRYNLSEILPEPTPMTWVIVRHFMSGRGGFGLMYRDLGYDPDPALDEEGIYDLVCGRPYCNLSREPRMQFRLLPFEHPFATLKADPHKALYPQPVLNPARGGWRFWLWLPWTTIKLTLAAGRVRGLSKTFAARFRKELAPPFDAETRRRSAEDLTRLEPAALVERLGEEVRRVLDDFARDSLKPTALTGVALDLLRQGLQGPLGAERTRTALGELVMGVHPDTEADLPRAVRDLAAGRLDRATFLEQFGHRSSQEMELAQPRWSEDPAAIDQLVAQSQGQSDLHAAASGDTAAEAWKRIADEARLNPSQRARLEAELHALHTFLGLRETAKHYLMKGYALVRRVLVELDRRFKLDGGVFFLTPEELPRLVAGEDLSALIADRRRRREIALSLEVPQVLFSDDLEAIGRTATVAGADTMQGVPVSAGVAEGPALVLEKPTGVTVPAEPYILVCPSTDPAWVPLFVHARGLLLETGGVLSHGAIVAREFGLPAVAGLADVHRRLRTGQRLRVDGTSGVVTVLPPVDV